MQARERLYLTRNRKKLVPAGHRDAALLYAVPGDEIPESAAARFGLVDGRLKAPTEKPAEGAGAGGVAKPPAKPKAAKGGGSTKEKAPAQDKEKKSGEDKGGGGDAGAGRDGTDGSADGGGAEG